MMFDKIKRKLSNMRSALSVKTHKTPRLFVILMMLGINVVILLIAAFIVLIIDDAYSNFVEAFALGSVTWMLAPNAILDIEQPQTLFLAVLVLLVGLVLFSGTIIALTTNTIRDYFEKKKTSSGKLYIEDHVLILNWNNKVPELIADLLYLKSERKTVVVLAEVDKHTAEMHIKNALLKKDDQTSDFKKLNVLIKPGNPINKNECLDASIEKAKTIIIMNKDVKTMANAPLKRSDLNVIKIILSLGHLNLSTKQAIVAEVKDVETKDKILTISKEVQALKDYHLIPICFDRRLGQIMAQTIIQHQMEDVYLSLFSFVGSEVYTLKNTPFETVLKHHTHATPVETLGDRTYVLAPNHQAKSLTTSTNLYQTVPLKVKPIDEKVNRTIFVLGHNNKQPFIQKAFDAYANLYSSDFTTHHFQDDEIERMVKTIKAKTDPCTVLLLSDESTDEQTLDANVINNLLYLKQHLNRDDVYIIAELLDPKNDPLIKDFNINNTIISNKIISLLISKLALFPATEAFYEDLLSIMPHQSNKDAQAISIKQASDIFNDTLPLRFETIKTFTVSLYEAYDQTLIPIGVIKDDQVKIWAGPLTKETLLIEQDDAVILMKL